MRGSHSVPVHIFKTPLLPIAVIEATPVRVLTVVSGTVILATPVSVLLASTRIFATPVRVLVAGWRILATPERVAIEVPVTTIFAFATRVLVTD